MNYNNEELNYNINFSVPKEYTKVYSVLNEIPNASRFICEAIIEKHLRMIEPVNIETQVLQALQNILKGNLQTNTLIEKTTITCPGADTSTIVNKVVNTTPNVENEPYSPNTQSTATTNYVTKDEASEKESSLEQYNQKENKSEDVSIEEDVTFDTRTQEEVDASREKATKKFSNW